MEPGPVVDLPFPVRAFPVRSVEPEFIDGAVGGEGGLEGPDIDVVVGIAPVVGVIPVPGGDVDPEGKAVFPTGVGEFPEDIPVPSLPGALRDRMAAFWIRP